MSGFKRIAVAHVQHAPHVTDGGARGHEHLVAGHDRSGDLLTHGLRQRAGGQHDVPAPVPPAAHLDGVPGEQPPLAAHDLDAPGGDEAHYEIGRASCRERV